MKNNADAEKEKKKIISFLSAFFLSFNIFFYAPLDMYLTNIKDITVKSKYILSWAIPLMVVSTVLLTVILYVQKERYNRIIQQTIWGLGLGFYIQGNFLQISASMLDGTKNEPRAGAVIINLIIWAVILAVPFLINRFFKDIYTFAFYFSIAAITVMEITALVFLTYKDCADDDTGIITSLITNNSSEYYLSQENEYTFSKEHNFIVILTDEYDSSAFDSALSEYSESLNDFRDFTYYRNTIGMFGFSDPAIANIFTGTLAGKDFSNETFFQQLKESGYRTDFLSTDLEFTAAVNQKYADNFKQYKIDFKQEANIVKTIYSLSMYKIVPEVFKRFFYLNDSKIEKNLSFAKAYYPDNLTFYNKINSTTSYTDQCCFKFIYLYGLHDPRNITADLKRSSDWSISPEEQAIAVNKILAEYLDKLREDGVYDCSDIIILADHGLKGNENGMYPLLMIKRVGSSSEELNISNAPISYADMYPTLIELVGGTPKERTVFEIGENEERIRYFAETDKEIAYSSH